MIERWKHVSNAGWQVLLLGLLGVPGVLFIPLLLRWLPVEAMASILVVQVYVYYLILITQYGFFLSGPAHLARLADPARLALWLSRSLKCKAVVLIGPVLLLFLLLLMRQWESDRWYLICFAALLLAYALNSNWFLQVLGDYASGVLYVTLGILAALLVLLTLWLVKDSWPNTVLACGAVGVLILPQTFLGLGSWWRSAHAMRFQLSMNKPPPGSLTGDLREGFPLVLSQLLALASATMGTVVVGLMADTDSTAAYAATEKIFNLGATVLIGLYTAMYPRLAEAYVADPSRYWQLVFRILAFLGGVGVVIIIILCLYWKAVFGLYLGDGLVDRIQSIWLPFGIWMPLCVVQPILSGYLVILQKNRAVLWINGMVLAVTLLVGAICVSIFPMAWVWGMVSGQLLVLFLLGWFYWNRASRESERLM